jgi:D-lactate dehydrogenase (cytochrome)
MCTPITDYKYQAIEKIRHELGEDIISTDDEVLQSHGYSEWSTININTLPVAVVFPRTTQEVSQIAAICYKSRVPMSKYRL